MKKDLMEVLACPLCKGYLELKVAEEKSDEILAGSLICVACRQNYPVDSGIPDLSPPELREPSYGGD